MPGEFDQSIDAAQAELSSQAPKEQEVRKHEEVYGSLVDQFQGMDSKLKLDTPEAKKEVDKGKKEVGDLLRRMAERGKWLIEGPVPSSGPDDKKSDKKSADKKGTVPKETTEIHSLASSLRGTLDTYSRKLTAISSIIEKKREAFNLLTAAYRVEAGADVVNVAPFVPPVFIAAIDKALYGEGGDGGCMAVYKMLRSNTDLPKEFVQETLLNIEEKQTQRLLEIKIRGQQQNLIDTQKLGDEALSKFVEMEAPKKPGEKPVFRFTSAGEQLSAEQKQLVLQAIAGVREANYEQVEAATCPKATERFWNGKGQFETGQFQEAKATLEAFIKEDLSTIAISSDPKLKGKKEAYEKQAKDILAQIEKVDGANKDFFDAQELAQAGDIIGAKKLLKKYLAEHKVKKEGEADFTGSARELLKRIALIQVTDARAKFQEYNKRPPEKIQRAKGSGRSTRSELLDNPEYTKWQKYNEALGTIEREINSGKYIDFTDAYNAVSAEMGGFNAKDSMNTLADQLILDNGRGGLLELARKYREMGKYFGDQKYLALAEQYFQEYFSKKLGETAQKQVTIEQLRMKYHSSPTVQAEITKKFDEVKDAVKKNYDEAVAKNPEWGRQNPWDSYAITARNAIGDKVLEGMRAEETVKMQNSNFISNAANVGDAGDQAAWGEFMNMKGLHGQGTAWEPFALSDEQVGRLVKDLPVDIAIIAASGALAAATGGAASGVLFTALLSTAERQALKVGARFAGRKLLAGVAGFAIETAMFTASHSVMNSVRTGELSIASFDQFMIEWGENVKVMGLLGLAGRASAALRLGRVSSLGVEMATMGSMHGKLTVDDWAIVLGLKIGHALPKAPGKVREALAERNAKKQAERAAVRNEKMSTLYRSVFLADASKIPPEMRGKPAYIDTNGRINYAPDAFAEFGVRAETRGKNTIFIIEDVGGPYRGNKVELTEREFLRIEMRAKNGDPLTPQQQVLLPAVRAVRQRMIDLKRHEVNHRVLETANNNSKGRLATALEELFTADPDLKRQLEERSAKANREKTGFESIQEFLSEVADGRINISAEQRTRIEETIAKRGRIKDFSFDGIRSVDTRMLADPRLLREHFTRERAAGSDILEGESANSLAEGMRAYETPEGINIAAATDKGRNYKELNEDRVVVDRQNGLVAAIDGMGGMGYGDVAAKVLAEEISRNPRNIEAATQSALARMATMNVGNAGACFAAVDIQRGIVYHAGDAKVIVYDKQGRIKFETKDDGLVASLVEAGILTPDEALYSGQRNVVTNGVINGKKPTIHTSRIELQPGDRVAVMSDGISDNLTGGEIWGLMNGRSSAEAVKVVSDVTDARMTNASDIVNNTGGMEGRARSGAFADGYKSEPKPDNRAFAVVDIPAGYRPSLSSAVAEGQSAAVQGREPFMRYDQRRGRDVQITYDAERGKWFDEFSQIAPPPSPHELRRANKDERGRDKDVPLEEDIPLDDLIEDQPSPASPETMPIRDFFVGDTVTVLSGSDPTKLYTMKIKSENANGTITARGTVFSDGRWAEGTKTFKSMEDLMRSVEAAEHALATRPGTIERAPGVAAETSSATYEVGNRIGEFYVVAKNPATGSYTLSRVTPQEHQRLKQGKHARGEWNEPYELSANQVKDVAKRGNRISADDLARMSHEYLLQRLDAPAVPKPAPGQEVTGEVSVAPERFAENANALTGVKTSKGYITFIRPDGTVVVSHLDPLNPANRGQTGVYQNVPFAEVATELTAMLRGRKTRGKNGEMFIDYVMPDGSVHLTTVDPRNPNAMTMAQMGDTVALSNVTSLLQNASRSNEVSPAAPKNAPNVLRVGSEVSVLNSRGDTVYEGFKILAVDGMTGEVTVQGLLNGQLATKTFVSMDSLARNMDYAQRLNSIPKDISLLYINGAVERGWMVRGIDPMSGKVSLENIDKRKIQLDGFEQFSDMLIRADRIKAENLREMAELEQRIPENIDIEVNGTIYEGLRIESIDRELGKVKIVTKDGRLGWEGVYLRDLISEVARTKQWRAEQEALRQEALRAPVQAPAQRTGVELARNEVKQPPEKVQRAVEVNMVGDLHGEHRALIDNLQSLGAIDANGKWTGGNRKIVFHGDILGDRSMEGVRALETLTQIREQARAAGGDIMLLAGNHDNWAVGFLSGRGAEGFDYGTLMFNSLSPLVGTQGAGLVEFTKRFATDPKMKAADPAELLNMFMRDQASFDTMRQGMLENMRRDPEGRRLLETICDMKLVEQIDDGLYLHTELTPEIVKMIESGQSVGANVDRVNAIYRQGMRHLLLGEGSMPAEYDAIESTFLNTNNRGYLRPEPALKQYQPKYKAGDLARLNEMGINFIVHGHNDVGPGILTRDGVQVRSVDNSYGKKGHYDGGPSLGRINTNGQLQNN